MLRKLCLLSFVLACVAFLAPSSRASCLDCCWAQQHPVAIDDDGNPIWPAAPDLEPDESNPYPDPIGPCTIQQYASCLIECRNRATAWGCAQVATACSAGSGCGNPDLGCDGTQHCYCQYSQCVGIGGLPHQPRAETLMWLDGEICHLDSQNYCP